MSTPILEVEKISVRFGGVQALDGLSLGIPAGMVTGLIGPNGAGKTTAFNVICGLQAPNGGRVLLDGRDVTALKPHRRARLGVARTFQRLEVFGSLSARDNLKVGAEIRKAWARDGSSPAAVADEVLARVGLTDVANERVESMPTGMARLVELGRALATRPRVLLLDEPSSGLNEEETDDLGRLLLELADEGLGILLVEHDVELVMRVCQHIHVMDFGRVLAEGAPAEIQANPEVQRAYLGMESTDHQHATSAPVHTAGSETEIGLVTAPPAAAPTEKVKTDWGKYGRKPVLLLAAVALIDAVDRGILPGTLETIKKDLGFSDFQLGTFNGALIITSMVMTVPSGYLADRFRRTRVIAIVLGTWGLISGMTALCFAYWHFLAVRGTLGVADTIDNPASASLVADYYKPAIRGRAYALTRIAPVIGQALGLAVAGAIAGALGWRWAFIIVGIPGSILAFRIWRLPEPTRGESDDAHATHDPGTGVRVMFRDLARVAKIRTLIVLMIGGAVGAASTSGIGFWAPAYYERHVGLSAGKATGLVGGVILLGVLAGTWVGGILTDRLRKRMEGAPMVIGGIGQIIGGTMIFLSFLGLPLGLQLPLQLVGVMGLVAAIPGLATMTSEIVPPAVRGAAFSLTAVLAALLSAGSTPLLGLIADQYPVVVDGDSVGNLALAFRVMIPLVAVAGAVVLYGRRYVANDLANVANA